jgi:hypothetical protein
MLISTMRRCRTTRRLGALVTLAALCQARLPGQTLGEALDQPDLVWSSSAWTAQTNVTHDGVDAATCVANSVPMDGWIETEVLGPTSVNFSWKSDNVAVNYLECQLDGVPQIRIAGVSDWQRRSVAVPAGPHTARWYFYATGVGGTVANAVWLDEISFGPASRPGVAVTPSSVILPAGQTAAFSGTASGPEPWSFAWCLNGTNLPTATAASLILTNLQARNSGNYTLIVSNTFGAVTSQVAVLTVLPSAPEFTTQPSGAKVLLGGAATFTALARGTEPLVWQWFHGDALVAGAAGTSLSLTNIQASDAGEYRLWATNTVGATSSIPALLEVILAPEFTLQPVAQGAAPGATIVLQTAVVASAPPSWQWYFNGAPIQDATNAQLAVTQCGPAKYGDYWVVATNGYGATRSAAARIDYSSLIAWGEKSCGPGPLQVPAVSNVVAISAGECHSLAVLADGTIRAWGDNSAGQSSVPSDATNVINVVAGGGGSLALRADGSVRYWGRAENAWSGPTAATNLIALASACGVSSYAGGRADGTVFWRSDASEIDFTFPGSVLRVAQSLRPANYDLTVVRVLCADGNLYGRTVYVPTDIVGFDASATNVVGLDASWSHQLVLRSDGSLVASGNNSYGQLNIPLAATNIIAIACGGTHCLALQDGGRLFAWGSDPDGEIDVPAWATNVAAISGSPYGSLALVGEGAPRISSQPVSLPATYGDTFRFLAQAVGAQPLRFQWLQDGSPIPGATRPWLLLPNLTNRPTSNFALLVSNSLGMATSQVAQVLDLRLAPRCVSPAQSVKAQLGGSAFLTAAFHGAPALAYRWTTGSGTLVTNNSRISGADSPVLAIRPFQSSDVGQYSLQASNAWGVAQSPNISLAAGTATEAFLQAVNQPSSPGWIVYALTPWDVDNATTHDGFLAARFTTNCTWANGLPPSSAQAVSFWWKVSSETNGDWFSFTLGSSKQVQISGETDWQFRSFELVGQPTLQWRYAKNAAITKGSDCGWLDQVAFGPGIPPALSRQPVGGIVGQGGSFNLIAEATGTEPFTCFWQRDGLSVGTRTNLLLITNAQAANTGNYVLIVSNRFGVATSQVARVDVRLNQPTCARKPDGSLSIKWTTGTLESAPTPLGPWTPVDGATTEFVAQFDTASRFFRVRQ